MIHTIQIKLTEKEYRDYLRSKGNQTNHEYLLNKVRGD